MTRERIIHLLEGYRQQKLTPEELDELRMLVDAPEESPVLDAFIVLFEQNAGHPHEISLDESRASAERIMAIDQSAFENRPDDLPQVYEMHFLRRWWWAAASILFMLAAGAYLWFNLKDKGTPVTTVQSAQKDVSPGNNGAILTLADGRQIVLDSVTNGTIATQDGAQVNLKNGRLTYDPTGENSGAVAFNTMTTPNGRQFQVTLPDGTRAWLNAASYITYPTIFTGTAREVKVAGEVYFEVAKNKQKPFIVSFNESRVEVLGTSFNVNAYENEPVSRTTLIEGSVNIRAAGKQLLLRPGQEAVKANDLVLNSEPNIKQVLAWKNGVFDFNDLKFTACMRQLERWYDIKVVYDGPVPSGTFLGKVDRDLTLLQAIKLLDGIVAKFRLEGRTLHVLPK